MVFRFALLCVIPSCAVAFNFPRKPAASRISRFDDGIQATATSLDPSLSTKEVVLDLLRSTPRNAPTSGRLTSEILGAVSRLEQECPTPDEEVLEKLSGSWELLWTAQDPDAPEANRLFRSWINPLENQSYSNNPSGRYNPILPRQVQDRLEEAGLASSAADLRSTQSIDLASQKVRNVVNVNVKLPSLLLPTKPQRASLTVTVDFRPNETDQRKIDVKFQECRIRAASSVDWKLPLGIVGPTGWLRTGYVDDNLRVTRGHKGSVFVLQRPSARPSTE